MKPTSSNQISRALAQDTGAALLSPAQLHSASLGNVMRLFRAHGVSEKERVEYGYYLQRMILEGFKKGVDIYKMIRTKVQNGGLSIGPIKETTHNARLQKFIGKVAKELISNHPRSFKERGISGSPRRAYNPQFFQDLEKQIAGATLGDTIQGAFSMLKTYQDMTPLSNPAGTRAGFLAGGGYSENIGMPAQQIENMDRGLRRFGSLGTDGLETANENEFGQGQMAMNGIASPMMSMDPPQYSGAGPSDSRAEMATGRPSKALVYTGSGAWSMEAQDYVRQLKAAGYQVDTTSSLKGVNYDQYGALFMPGGKATTEYNGIGGAEAQRLREAIGNGLNYYGACAGAFLIGDYGGWGLKLVNKSVDYPNPNASFYKDKVMTKDTLEGPLSAALGGDKDQYIVQYGGPKLDNLGGTVLARYPNGEVSMTALNYGKGQVIVTGGHPGINGKEIGLSDPDDDTALFKALADFTMKGQLAGTPNDGGTGTQPGTGGGGTGGTGGGGDTNVTNTNVTNIPPNTMPMVNIAGPPGSGGGGPRVTGSINTPVAGMLDPSVAGQTKSFAAGIQSVGGASASALSQIAGSLTRLGGSR